MAAGDRYVSSVGPGMRGFGDRNRTRFVMLLCSCELFPIMVPDSAVSEGSSEHGEIMAAVDGDTYVIADVSRDGAWLSMPRNDAPILADHC